MLYQEQLLQVLKELGGFTIFEADKVRRLVRKIGKSKTSEENRKDMYSETDVYKEQYMEYAVNKILNEDKWSEAKAKDYAERQWNALMGQAKYSFNMPHSYSYSLMGYVQAYLKCYWPVEFWTAALNTIDRGQEKHNESTLGKYINSINSMGITLARPNVNKSDIMFENDGNTIYFALSYVKDVAKGAEDIINHRPYKDWDDFFEKAIENKFNKRIIKALIFSGAVDFDDDMEARSYKWMLYLSKKGKKAKEELDEFQAKMPEKYELIHLEYEHCKYSFTGIETFLKDTKYKTVKPISERDTSKKLWVLIGYISDMTTKTSKKGGNEYLLLTVTDFRDTIGVFCFGADYRSRILKDFSKGDLVKIAVKNDSNWLKLPFSHELGGKFPIEKL
jgi:DNA polymerase III alpha subunit